MCAVRVWTAYMWSERLGRQELRCGPHDLLTCTLFSTHGTEEHACSGELVWIVMFSGCGNTSEGEDAGQRQWARQAPEAHALIPRGEDNQRSQFNCFHHLNLIRCL